VQWILLAGQGSAQAFLLVSCDAVRASSAPYAARPPTTLPVAGLASGNQFRTCCNIITT